MKSKTTAICIGIVIGAVVSPVINTMYHNLKVGEANAGWTSLGHKIGWVTGELSAINTVTGVIVIHRGDTNAEPSSMVFIENECHDPVKGQFVLRSGKNTGRNVDKDADCQTLNQGD